MIRLRCFIERARRKPVVGLLVLVLLVALLALVALHPALDALELAASCLTILAVAVSIGLALKPSTPPVSGVLQLVSRARPPTRRTFAAAPQPLVPLRL